MKKLIKHFLLYILLMFLTLSGILLACGRQFSKDYTAAIVEKLQRLESIQGPKIVLVGDSSLVFGMNSAMLEEAMGMPVVNLGLHGGLDYQFHYNMAKGHIGPGDIVILANLSFGDGRIDNADLAWITIENRSDLWKLIPWEDIPAMVAAFPGYVMDTLDSVLTNRMETVSGAYSRAAFNEYGDIGVYLDNYYVPIPGYSIQPPEITREGIRRVNDFAAYCESQGAVCLMSGYPVVHSEYTASDEEFIRFQQELEQQLEFPLISDYLDYQFDYTLFSDTLYHLSTEGASVRTQQLIRDLQAWQNQ